jgi:transposase
METVDNAITKPVHRLEVFTGAGRPRSFSAEDKARIVAKILTSGDSVSGVARRHGLSSQQLFGWRRQLRESRAEPGANAGCPIEGAALLRRPNIPTGGGHNR